MSELAIEPDATLAKAADAVADDAPTILRILDLARWAPSGDNTQPWRFELRGHRHVVVHGFDTRAHCVYDLDGRASQIALGGLLETIAIAASDFGLATSATRQPDSGDETPRFDVRFTPDPTLPPDPLSASIRSRSVQRRALRTTPLSEEARRTLTAAVGPEHALVWREGTANRARMATFLFRSARLRLVMPEAYLVHREVIEWSARYSTDRVPEEAVGVDPSTARLMRWAMTSWERVAFLNRFLAGTWVPRLQLDVWPALRCAGHFFLVRRQRAVAVDDFIASGRAMQRLWLAATRLGLQLQPEMTPLIFARYGRERRHFSRIPKLHDDAVALAGWMDAELGSEAAGAAVFMGRVGSGAPARARSLRRSVDELRYDSVAGLPGAPRR